MSWRQRLRAGGLLCCGVLGVWCCGACDQRRGAPADVDRSGVAAEQSRRPGAAVAQVSASAAADQSSAGNEGDWWRGPPAAALHQGDGFRLALHAAGPYQVGRPGRLEVEVQASGPYKCNQEYPYKLKVRPEPGIRYERDAFGKEALVLSKTRAVLTVDFTPESAGRKVVGGRLSFSVCTEERCLVEKRDLALAVDVR